MHRLHAFRAHLLPVFGFLLFAGAFSPAPAHGEHIVDTAWLTGSHWDDGLAEIAFYQVERTRNQYGRTQEQSFLVGTYLVKHDFDPLAQAKAGSGPGRLLLKLEAESGRYRMTLVEALRSAYWQENFFPRLEQVHSRP